jgi:hypothetical protein
MVQIIVAAAIVVRAIGGNPAVYSGVATYYPAEKFEGQPLYCDQFLGGGLTYAQENMPFVALPLSWYRSGLVECGDTVTLVFEDGRVREYVAYDSGMFYDGNYHVIGMENEKIIADLPGYALEGLPHGMAWKVVMVLK